MVTYTSHFATHDLEISFSVFEAGLIVFMGAVICALKLFFIKFNFINLN